MAFQQNAFQNNSFQVILANLLKFVKLILGLPNKPFKKAQVTMNMKRGKVKMELKNTDLDDV